MVYPFYCYVYYLWSSTELIFVQSENALLGLPK